jgi:methionyl-tRNA formyltransferase
MVRGKKVRIYDVVCHRTRTFHAVPGKPGEVCAMRDQSVDVAAQGGRLELRTVRLEAGAKMAAGAFAAALRISVGAALES